MPLDSLCILSNAGECLTQCSVASGAAPLSLSTLLAVSSCITMMRGATRKAHTDGDASSHDTRESAEPKEADGAASSAAEASTSSSSGLCSVSVGGHKFVALDVFLSGAGSGSGSGSGSGAASSSSSSSGSGCSCTLIAQGPGDESDAYLGSMLHGVREILLAYLGQGVVSRSASSASASSAASAGAAPIDDSECASAIRGLRDVVQHYLVAAQTDVSYLVGGNRWVHIAEDTRQHVDRVLAQLEESAAAGGKDGSSAAASELTGSMLVLGGSILHSRMSPSTSRLLVQHLACRPLGPGSACKLRTVPLYVGGVWQHFLMLRLRHHTLVVSASIRCSLSRLSSLLLSWEDQWMESTGLSLPAEEAPVLLRHYTGHDTIAFLYTHHATGVTVAPPPRNSGAPGSSMMSAPAAGGALLSNSQSQAQRLAEHVNQQEVAKTMQVFHWFYARANQLLSNKSYVSESILHLKGYRFYGVHEQDFSLFILYTENVGVSSLAAHNKEILENVLRHNGGLITAE